jgi:hypothetical protein
MKSMRRRGPKVAVTADTFQGAVTAEEAILAGARGPQGPQGPHAKHLRARGAVPAAAMAFGGAMPSDDAASLQQLASGNASTDFDSEEGFEAVGGAAPESYRVAKQQEAEVRESGVPEYEHPNILKMIADGIAEMNKDSDEEDEDEGEGA